MSTSLRSVKVSWDPQKKAHTKASLTEIFGEGIEKIVVSKKGKRALLLFASPENALDACELKLSKEHAIRKVALVEGFGAANEAGDNSVTTDGGGEAADGFSVPEQDELDKEQVHESAGANHQLAKDEFMRKQGWLRLRKRTSEPELEHAQLAEEQQSKEDLLGAIVLTAEVKLTRPLLAMSGNCSKANAAGAALRFRLLARNGRHYELEADSVDDSEAWVAALKQNRGIACGGMGSMSPGSTVVIRIGHAAGEADNGDTGGGESAAKGSHAGMREWARFIEAHFGAFTASDDDQGGCKEAAGAEHAQVEAAAEAEADAEMETHEFLSEPVRFRPGVVGPNKVPELCRLVELYRQYGECVVTTLRSDRDAALAECERIQEMLQQWILWGDSAEGRRLLHELNRPLSARLSVVVDSTVAARAQGRSTRQERRRQHRERRQLMQEARSVRQAIIITSPKKATPQWQSECPGVDGDADEDGSAPAASSSNSSPKGPPLSSASATSDADLDSEEVSRLRRRLEEVEKDCAALIDAKLRLQHELDAAYEEQLRRGTDLGGGEAELTQLRKEVAQLKLAQAEDELRMHKLSGDMKHWKRQARAFEEAASLHIKQASRAEKTERLKLLQENRALAKQLAALEDQVQEYLLLEAEEELEFGDVRMEPEGQHDEEEYDSEHDSRNEEQGLSPAQYYANKDDRSSADVHVGDTRTERDVRQVYVAEQTGRRRSGRHDGTKRDSDKDTDSDRGWSGSDRGRGDGDRRWGRSNGYEDSSSDDSYLESRRRVRRGKHRDAASRFDRRREQTQRRMQAQWSSEDEEGAVGIGPSA